MSNRNKLLLTIGFAAAVVAIVSATMLALAYNGAVAELEKMRGEREAVSNVERFIEKARPALDPATRRGMAEFMIEAAVESRIPYQVLVNVGHAESRFIQSATGDDGESHGTFQVQGFWVKEIPFLKTQRDLYRTDLGIRAGAWVLRYMADRCGEEPERYLACYNGGEKSPNEQARAYARRVASGV